MGDQCLQGLQPDIGRGAPLPTPPEAESGPGGPGAQPGGEAAGRAHPDMHAQRPADDRGHAEPEISFT